MKESAIQQKYCGKYISPQEMLVLLKKNEHNRIWMLKQLSQLGIDIQILQDCPLHQLYKHCDQIIKSTYSIKYLGMNQNEMGIISRRIDPFKDSDFTLKDLPQCPYKVSKFFYPKPLKVSRKPEKQNQLTSQNLQQSIKNAFVHKKIEINKKQGQKKPNKLLGSWLNSTVKEGFGNSPKCNQVSENQRYRQKSNDNSKKFNEVNIKLPGNISTFKNSTSYSGFLKSGVLVAHNYEESRN